jgi:Co/Zn/Cd efflux system component
MADCGSCDAELAQQNKSYAKTLKLVLALNFIMLLVESVAAYYSKSASLQADALDFLSDSITYASSLYVLSLATIWQSRVAFIKGLMMGCFGLVVIGNAIYRYLLGAIPHAETISLIGIVALLVNLSAALMLARHRHGDSNKLSVWMCSRNDAIANILVILAGITVYFTQSNLPDIVVALIIGSLVFSGSWHILRKSYTEIKNHASLS